MMPVTSMTMTGKTKDGNSVRIHVGPAPKPRRKLGDRKIIKGVEHVCVQVKAYDGYGNFVGYQVTRHGPCLEWVPVVTPVVYVAIGVKLGGVVGFTDISMERLMGEFPPPGYTYHEVRMHHPTFPKLREHFSKEATRG